MTTKSPKRLIALLLKLPNGDSLITRGRDKPACISCCPAEGEDSVVVATAPCERYLWLHLACVLHVHAPVFVGKPQQMLRAGHRAEVQRIGWWLWIHLGAGEVWCNGGIVIVDSADERGNQAPVSECSGQDLETTELPTRKIAPNSALGARHLKV